MSEDWYDKGVELLLAEIAETAEVSIDVARAVYNAASEIGVAGDYDVEKEIIWDRYFDDEGE